MIMMMKLCKISKEMGKKNLRAVAETGEIEFTKGLEGNLKSKYVKEFCESVLMMRISRNKQ